MTLRRRAVGEVDLPHLGRIRVDAQLDRGVVDVSVVAQRSTTAALLGAQSAEIARELREHAVPLRSLDFGAPTPTGSGGATSSDRQGRDERGDGPTHTSDADSAPPAPRAHGARGRRVRIVL